MVLRVNYIILKISLQNDPKKDENISKDRRQSLRA